MNGRKHTGSTRQQRLRALSDSLLTSTGYIAGETDRWFLGAVLGAKRCADRTREGFTFVGKYITQKTWVSRLPGVKKKTPSERLRRVILAEAKRVGIRPEDPEFAAFAERIAVLTELVLEGTIPASAIDFEEGGEPLEGEAYVYSEAPPQAERDGEPAQP